MIFTNLNFCCIIYLHLFIDSITLVPGNENILADTFSWLRCFDVYHQFQNEKSAPVVIFNFISKGLALIDDPDLLKCFCNLTLLDVAENNPVDLISIHTQENTVTEFAMKAINYPGQNFNRILLIKLLNDLPYLTKIVLYNRKFH